MFHTNKRDRQAYEDLEMEATASDIVAEDKSSPLGDIRQSARKGARREDNAYQVSHQLPLSFFSCIRVTSSRTSVRKQDY